MKISEKNIDYSEINLELAFYHLKTSVIIVITSWCRIADLMQGVLAVSRRGFNMKMSSNFLIRKFLLYKEKGCQFLS